MTYIISIHQLSSEISLALKVKAKQFKCVILRAYCYCGNLKLNKQK